MTDLVKSAVPQWFRVRQYVLPALILAATHDEADVLIGILEGYYQLWPGQESAIVTEIRTYPRMKVIHFWLVGGDLNEVLGMEEPIIRWARGVGCTRATAAGRKGWARTLKHWTFHTTTLFRDISDE